MVRSAPPKVEDAISSIIKIFMRTDLQRHCARYDLIFVGRPPPKSVWWWLFRERTRAFEHNALGPGTSAAFLKQNLPLSTEDQLKSPISHPPQTPESRNSVS